MDAAALVPEAQVVLMGGEPEQIARLRARGTSCVFAGKRATAELPAFLRRSAD